MSNTKANEKMETQAGSSSDAGVSASEVVSQGNHAPGLLRASADEVLLKYTHCAHCQARLHFSYLTDFSRNLTQETARCPECQNQAHRVMHRLQ